MLTGMFIDRKMLKISILYFLFAQTDNANTVATIGFQKWKEVWVYIHTERNQD